MALPAAIQAIVTRFRGTNNNAYNAATNPLGMGQGGQRQNFPPRLKDMADALDFVADRTDQADANTALTAEDASNTAEDRIATSQDRTAAAGSAGTAKTEADRAAGFAAGLKLPGISAAVAGFFMRVKADGSGYETSRLDFASQARAEAGLDQTTVMNPLRTSQAIMALAGDVVKEVYAANTTFVKQPDDIGYLVECIGAGASGAKSGVSGDQNPHGGGPGEIIEHFFAASEVPNNLPLTIGAGGNAVTTGPSSGNAGGVTSFGTLLRAFGGLAGNTSGGGGWIHVFGSLGRHFGTDSGGMGTPFQALKLLQGQRFAAISPLDAARPAPVLMPTAGGGIASGTIVGTVVETYGDYGRGGAASVNANAQAGQIPGGGGGAVGSAADLASGAGARGEIRVFRFKRRKAA